MTTQVPERLRSLSDAATPGEWWEDRHVTGQGWIVGGAGYRIAHIPGDGDEDRSMEDATFIAAAVNYVRDLLSGQPLCRGCGEVVDTTVTVLFLYDGRIAHARCEGRVNAQDRAKAGL